MSGRAPLLAGAALFEVSPFTVDEGQRIGFLHEDKAAALGRLMAVDGQRDPIKVVANPKDQERPWRLVTGMHRLIGARIEGLTVWAIEVSGKSEDLADLEASENLHRRPLAPIERAKFTAALVQAAQDRIARQHGDLKHQQRGAKARWDKVRSGAELAHNVLTTESEDAYAKLAQAYSWEESVGDALGMSRRSIHRDLELFRLLIEPFPDVIEPLAKHPVVGENASQLRAICQVREERRRREVIEALLADPEIGAEDARIQAGVDVPAGTAPLPQQKFVNAIVGSLDRLTAAQQKQHLQSIATAFKSNEVKRRMRDLLNEELGEKPDAEKLVPAVALHTSVKPDYIVCLEDGTRHLNLTARLVKLGMTPTQYRERWKLPRDYPMLAPNYRHEREQIWRNRLRTLRAELADAR